MQISVSYLTSIRFSTKISYCQDLGFFFILKEERIFRKHLERNISFLRLIKALEYAFWQFSSLVKNTAKNLGEKKRRK